MYSEESTSFKHRYPLRAIALDPRYGQRKTREFVTGGDSGELVLHSRVGCGLSLRKLLASNSQSMQTQLTVIRQLGVLQRL